MSPAWLSSLLRARQVQEDVARQRLAGARHDALQARRSTLAISDRIDAMVDQSSPESALAFIAAASARQAAAATWSAARHAEAAATDQVTVRETAVVGAARQRRSVEKLDERYAAQEKADATSAAQQELDEIGVRRHGRTAGGAATDYGGAAQR